MTRHLPLMSSEICTLSTTWFKLTFTFSYRHIFLLCFQVSSINRVLRNLASENQKQMAAGSMYPALYNTQWGRPAGWYHPNNPAALSAPYHQSLPPVQQDIKPKGKCTLLSHQLKRLNISHILSLPSRILVTSNLCSSECGMVWTTDGESWLWHGA